MPTSQRLYRALDGGGGLVVGGAGREGDGRAEADFHVAAAQEGELHRAARVVDDEPDGHDGQPALHGQQAGSGEEGLYGAAGGQLALGVYEHRPALVEDVADVLEAGPDGALL